MTRAISSQFFRRALWPIWLLPSLFLILSCATNPLTGGQNIALIPEEMEIELGKEGEATVVKSMGLYDDPALSAYVAGIGKTIAAKSERPALPWRFQVVDDPMVNAFALGGGAIFVTRGLLAHLSSEAQLAAVLGHEVGHVTARHAVRTASKHVFLQAGLALGHALWKKMADHDNLINPVVGLLMLRYSRDDEREADNLAYRYAVGTGYEIREAPTVFRMFKRVADLDGRDTPIWLSSHPESEARADHFDRRIVEQPPPVGKALRDEFLAVTSNLVYGPDPRHGFFEGGTFKTPSLMFQITPPADWQALIKERSLVTVNNQETSSIAGITVQPVTEVGTAQEALDKHMSQEGTTRGEALTVAMRVPHIGARFAAKDDDGKEVAGAVIFFNHNNTLLRAGFASAPEKVADTEKAFRATMASFAPLTDGAALAAAPARLKLVSVAKATTLAELAHQYPAVPVERLAIMNQLAADAPLEAGTKIKVVEGTVREDKVINTIKASQ